jgi:MvdD-like protein with pre-ATP grasp domain
MTHVVIVTDIFDAHADIVIKALAGIGHEAVRVNSSDIPLNTALTAGLDPGRTGALWSGALRITTNDRAVDWDRVSAVWWRKPTGYGLAPELGERERDFAQEELDHVMRGLWAGLDCYWMSRPDAIAGASYKVEQLRRAARLGFDVPRTVVTSEVAAVRELAARCDNGVVYKVLSDPTLGARKAYARDRSARPEPIVVSTTPIDPDRLDDLGSLELLPCLFQEYVPKRVEHRVTVIGDDVFVAEIDSQPHEDARVDWRDGAAQDTFFRAARLPDVVVARCVELVRSYDLQFGALDLVETPDGRHVFLEINPNGQFLFVQDRVPQFRMAEATAARLVRGLDP